MITSHADHLVGLVDDLARLTADPRRRQRLAISFVLALVITLLLGIAARWQPPRTEVAEHPDVTTVVFERRPSPRPTPKLTPPPPTPPPAAAPVVRATLAPVQVAAPHKEAPRGGAKAAPLAVVPKIATIHKPAAHVVPAGGTAQVAGSGSGPGAGNGNGPGEAGGNGNGTGGNGTGAVDASAPCGYVEFIPVESPRITGSTSYEKIRATVHFPDGHTESDEFPYPWVYANAEVTDPWSATNLRRASLDVRAQLPPPGANSSRYPEVIRYVLEHTTPAGITILQECPRLR